MLRRLIRHWNHLRRRMTAAVCLGLCLACSSQLPAQTKSTPEFQYQSGEIRVSLPSADEPRVAAFGPDSVRAAAQYLEDGAVSWVREKSCVNCHTTGPYLTERTAWSARFGPPSDEVRADFIESLPGQLNSVKPVEQNGHTFYPGAFSAVWRAAGLAVWDQHITGTTSEPTERALRDMFARQSESGAFVSHGEVEIPHITTDFELSLQAARAMTAAPGWLAGLQDETLITGTRKLQEWLRTAPPQNDFDRALRLQLGHYLPELVTSAEREAAISLLAAKQHADGGWSTRDMSPVRDWHFEMSDTVLNLIASLPDAAAPESDAYMTALAIVLLRQGGVAATDPRVQRGLDWLKREQRVSGRWWMHSLYRGNYHYITYIATVEALKALELCGELPEPQTARPRLQIINGTSSPVDVFWLKSPDERVSNGSVDPGQDSIITTTLGHQFVIVSRADSSESVVTSEAAVQAFRVGGLPAFYTQSASAEGFPVVASANVSPYALQEAVSIINQMLAQRPDVRTAMIKSGARLSIMAHNEFTTDLPEWARMADEPPSGFQELPAKDYWDARARGMGGSETDPYCSCAEENLLAYEGDPYSTENILIHELAHNIHLRGMNNVDPTFDARVRSAWYAAQGDGLWTGKYAAVNHHEYFAEGVQSWFDDNRENDHDHNHVNTRAELIEYDPRLAALCREVFGDTEFRYTKPATRLTGHLAGYDPANSPRFEFPARLHDVRDKIREAARQRDATANAR